MSGRWTKDFNFVSASLSNGHLVVALTAEETAREAQDLTVIVVWHGSDRWLFVEEPYLWSVVDSKSYNSPSHVAAFLGMRGQVLLTNGETTQEEIIAPPPDNQKGKLGPMCGLAVVENTLYAVGMGRQVYQRNTKGNWSCLDQTIRPAANDESIVGFNAIDGFSQNELYTVGFNGEIWWRETNRWVQIDSPTNLPLYHVFCDIDNQVYACGHGGILLAGRGEDWAVLADEETDDDLWSITKFRDRLYLLGTHGLYILDNDELVHIPITGESCGFGQRLLVGQDKLWLIGPKDLLIFDGKNWERID